MPRGREPVPHQPGVREGFREEEALKPRGRGAGSGVGPRSHSCEVGPRAEGGASSQGGPSF